ncbi:tRNA (adenosine(37)-N6)-threonylcarbamoyltransferase complex ATPase subunit type 1 TsaE [Membranihabitans maritimus]|uniref:tRNA (adenosine(37)-N6)-threonylcarbamoyltransferase complex ATPase subunit type 1 TsaE n=1 Tax=Membranihabitans maritimus TaxID=2904244 RepID=UPI001F02B626
MEQWVVNKEEDYKDIMPEVAEFIVSSKIVLLNGEMGSGKTTFVRHLNQFLGADQASSPTFSIVNQYQYDNGIINHFDLYRLERADELSEIGFEEYLESGNLCLIEWPALGKNYYPENTIIIEFSIIDKSTRKLVLNSNIFK